MVNWSEVKGTAHWTAERFLREEQGFKLAIGSSRRFLLREDGVEVVTRVASWDKMKLRPDQVALRLNGKWLYGRPDELREYVPAKGQDDADAVRRLSAGRWM